MRPKTFENRKRLHVLLDETLLTQIRNYAELEDLNVSEFVRRAIENEIAAIDKKKADIESPINKLK